MLNRSPSRFRYEVINMGVGGYQTLQEAEMLREKGLKYHPDLVVVAFVINDFDFKSDGMVYERLLKANPGLDFLSTRPGFNSSLLGKSRLAFVVHHRLRILLGMHTGYPWSTDSYQEKYFKGRTCVEAGFDRLDALQKKYGFPILVCIIPAFDQPFDSYGHRAIHDRALAILKSHPGINAVDLLPEFMAVDNNGPVFMANPIHPNPYGHKVLAEILFKQILPYLPEKKALEKDKGAGSASRK